MIVPSVNDWISPNVEIKYSSLGGKGMFAKEPINKGEKVLVWGGVYGDKKAADKAKKEEKLIMQWDENLYSIEQRGDSEGYFLNHSCKPNVWMEDAFTLTAMRDIKRGEELTADYAMWEADENYVSTWQCKCGSVNCRKRVTGRDWMLSELQQEYRDHFSPLLNKRINKMLSTALPIH